MSKTKFVALDENFELRPFQSKIEDEVLKEPPIKKNGMECWTERQEYGHGIFTTHRFYYWIECIDRKSRIEILQDINYTNNNQYPVVLFIDFDIKARIKLDNLQQVIRNGDFVSGVSKSIVTFQFYKVGAACLSRIIF